MRSYIVVFFTKHYGDEIKEEMGGTWSIHLKSEKSKENYCHKNSFSTDKR
jgi:hypothetical protein